MFEVKLRFEGKIDGFSAFESLNFGVLALVLTYSRFGISFFSFGGIDGNLDFSGDFDIRLNFDAALNNFECNFWETGFLTSNFVLGSIFGNLFPGSSPGFVKPEL